MQFVILILIAALIAVLLVALAILFIFVGKGKKRIPLAPRFDIDRLRHNPLIRPTYEWNAQGTFNPAAAVDDQGRVHMLYRAVGSDGVSRFGYAGSGNGTDFDDRLPYPVFALDYPRQDTTPAERRYDVIAYPSGGSWGGAEDPRLVIIEDRAYVTFNAFDSWNSIRIGVISMQKDDFFKKRFKWTNPMLISPANQANKNWVLFPEKIRGKFAILHSITPKILIDYVSDLRELSSGTTEIQSPRPSGGRKSAWDTKVRGAGPPPLKTSKGWLLFYHAINEKEPDKYKLGAMLLDLDDPTKVIARAPAPVLTPDMWYENDWKPGIVYACGAVVRNDELFIYYGGGDRYVCAAHTPLAPFLDWLVQYGKQNSKKR